MRLAGWEGRDDISAEGIVGFDSEVRDITVAYWCLVWALCANCKAQVRSAVGLQRSPTTCGLVAQFSMEICVIVYAIPSQGPGLHGTDEACLTWHAVERFGSGYICM